MRIWSVLGASAIVAYGLFSAASCTTDTVLQDGLVLPTGVLVNPTDFLGDVVCSTRPGGMQSYVATLIDVSDPANPFVLPSGLPTPCSLGSDFRFVVAGHVYIAELDGYEIPALDLAPLGGMVSGSRHMVVTGSNSVATPRWTSSCGLDGAAATASFDVDVVIKNCDAMTDHAGASTTGVEVDPWASLPSGCEAHGGEVTTFDVLPSSAALAPALGLDCATMATIEYQASITPGTDYAFTVIARDALGASIGTSRCSSVAREGIVTIASCDALDP